MIDVDSAAKLTAFVQGDDAGAPAGAVYESHSGSIIDTLQDLLGKAQEQLDSARKAEVDATHKFEMLEQSLTDAVKVSQSEISECKQGLAEQSKSKATQEGDL